MSRRKFDDVPTLPMFDEPARTGKQRRRTARPLAHASCPHCTGAKVAIVASGGHLVWREHFYTTWSGARIACSASGAGLCVAPPRRETGVVAPCCPHPHEHREVDDEH